MLFEQTFKNITSMSFKRKYFTHQLTLKTDFDNVRDHGVRLNESLSVMNIEFEYSNLYDDIKVIGVLDTIEKSFGGKGQKTIVLLCEGIKKVE